jgi:hypothetical protein
VTRQIGYGSEPASQAASHRQRIERLERRPPPPTAKLHIKVFPDVNYPAAAPIVAGEGMFIFECSKDMDELQLFAAESYVTTAGGGPTVVQVRNETAAVDMLTSPLQVDSGELNSRDSGSPVVILASPTDTLTIVSWGDHIAIDVDAAGSGAFGLGVILTFG